MTVLRGVLAAFLVVLGVALAPTASAQSGSLSGVVADATGAVLPGATVVLRGGPGGLREARTDARGSFAFDGLAPGEYAVAVLLSGFGDVTVDAVAVGADPVALPPITLRLASFADAAVVTATRIEEPLAEVPMSISAVTGADIESRAIDNLTELARWTPGLTVVDQGARGSNVVIVRGLHTDALNGSEAAGNNYNIGVATYLGDIPLAIDLRLHDIERVEVLLGPQGTLYGAGTLAGAVRYLPRRPDTERRTLEVRGDLFGLSHGGAPGGDAGVTFNLPLVARRLALRGSVDRYENPGFIDYDYLVRTPGVSEPEPDLTDPEAVAANLYRRADANTEQTLSARLSLLWEPTTDLAALVAYHLQDQRVGGRQINHARSFGTGRYVSAHRYLEPNDRKNELLSVEVTWGLGFAELTSATGFSRYAAEGQRDQTDLLIQAFGIGGLLPGTYPGLLRAQALEPGLTAAELTSRFRTFSAYTREDGREERFNWEARLVSTGDGPWRWVGGAFFNNYDSRGTSFEYAPGLTEFSGITPILGGRAVDEPVEYYSYGLQDVTERALFGELTRELGDRWRVTGGGRWFDYRVGTGSLTEFPYTPMYNSPFTAFDSDDRGYLLKGSVSYRFDERTNAYFTRSEGYRIGGGNNFRVCSDEEIALLTDADPANDPPQSGCIYEDQALIRPDTTTNYEVGVRRSWRDERYTLSATWFHVDWTDIQVAGLTPFSGPADHAERGWRGEPRGGAGLGGQPDRRAAPARVVVVHGGRAQPGLAGPPRRRGRRVRGRPPLGRAAPAGEPARLLRHPARPGRRSRGAVRLQLHRRRPDPDRHAGRGRGAPRLRRPQRVGVDHAGRLDADLLRRQPARPVRGDRRAADARAHRTDRGRLPGAPLLRQRAGPAAGGPPDAVFALTAVSRPGRPPRRSPRGSPSAPSA